MRFGLAAALIAFGSALSGAWGIALVCGSVAMVLVPTALVLQLRAEAQGVAQAEREVARASRRQWNELPLATRVLVVVAGVALAVAIIAADAIADG